MRRFLFVYIAGVLSVFVCPMNGSCLDMARKWMNVDKVNGLDRPLAPGIPHPFRGKNVIFGIIDVEFDIHEPAFLDAQKKTRFIALWDQDTNTTRRNNTSYGKIKKGPALNDDSTFGLITSQGHGTAMASFGAGSDTSLPYFGIAPEAMIIGVKYNSNYVEQDVVNGLFWISNFADSLGVPCVVSMSIGLAAGPHDGTSIVDQAIDNFSDSGRIVVGAIGNDADKQSHISFQLEKGQAQWTWVASKTDSIKNPPRARSFSAVDIWGEVGKPISIDLALIDDRMNAYKSTGNSLSTQQSRSYRDTVKWTDSLTKVVDTCYFLYEVEKSSSLNRKPHITISMLSYNPHLFFGMGVSLLNNASGPVHAWNLEKLAFKDFGINGFYHGDSISTLNEIGGTAKSIISVGSYINKSKVVTYNDSIFDKKTENNIGNWVGFSGIGPTIDGRIKPDICAPGDMVIGALSRRDGFNWQISIWPDTTSTYGRYVRETGTSVSSPLVAGAIALLLEASPKLTVDSIKSLLRSTAIKDNFTGDLSVPDNRWGMGKINVYGALSRLLGTSASGTYTPAFKQNDVALKVLSFGEKRYLAICGLQMGRKNTFSVSLFDCAGHRLMRVECSEPKIAIPEKIGKGVYFAKVLFNGKALGSKIAIY
jgi:minor extracellular serine protease Vpr